METMDYEEEDEDTLNCLINKVSESEAKDKTIVEDHNKEEDEIVDDELIAQLIEEVSRNRTRSQPNTIILGENSDKAPQRRVKTNNERTSDINSISRNNLSSRSNNGFERPLSGNAELLLGNGTEKPHSQAVPCESYVFSQIMKDVELAKFREQSKKNLSNGCSSTSSTRDIYFAEKSTIYSVEEDDERGTNSCESQKHQTKPEVSLPDRGDVISSQMKQNAKTKMPKKNNFICKICDKVYLNEAQATKHKKKVHGSGRKFTCEFCPKVFNQLTNLKSHRYLHTGQRPYKCSVCGAAFANPSNLKGHQKIHSEEKNLTCEICGKAYKWMFSLKAHLRTHQGIKPYICEVCGRAFGQLSNLREHTRAHRSDVDPLICKDCGAQFRHSRSVRKHRSLRCPNSKDAKDDARTPFYQKSIILDCGPEFSPKISFKKEQGQSCYNVFKVTPS